MKELLMIIIKQILLPSLFCLGLAYSQANIPPQQIDKMIKESGMSKKDVMDIIDKNKGS